MAIQTNVEGRGLVENVGNAPRSRLHVNLMPALLGLGGMDALEFFAQGFHVAF